MLSKLHTSFRLQLGLWFVGLVVVVGFSSLFYLNHQQQKFIKASIQSEGEAVTQLIARDIAKLIYLDDPDIAASITYQIKNIQQIYSAQFFDSNKQPLLKISPRENNPPSNAITISTNMSYSGIALGTARIIFHSPLLNNEQKKAHNLFKLLFLSLLIFGVLFVFYIDKNFISRLAELSHALKRSANENNYSLRLKTDKNDEIGLARKHFNQLVRTVEDNTQYLSFQAHHDNLTGLYNRNKLLAHINKLLINRPNNGNVHAVCYLDLDQFKVVNDSCGHSAGDELLQQLSRLLLSTLKSYSGITLGRIGGDEFLLLAESISPNRIKRILDDINIAVEEFYFCYLEREFPVGVSIGCVLIDDEKVDADELLSAADAACYQVKNQGRGGICIYKLHDPQLHNYQQSMDWVSKLYHAMEHDEFELYLQPIVLSKDEPITPNHFEVLIRLADHGEIVSPEIFVPIAERFGLSKKVDLWVIKSLCATLDDNADFLARIDLISINLSALSIVDSSIMLAIDKILQSYKIPLQKICFEITETSVISDFKSAQVFIQFFKQQGVRFSLDDFGSGMASFGYLNQLNVDILKIDGSFIRDIQSDDILLEMTRAMISIGKITHKKIVAEHVETKETATLLSQMGVDYLQGFYFCKPQPIKTFIDNIPCKEIS